MTTYRYAAQGAAASSRGRDRTPRATFVSAAAVGLALSACSIMPSPEQMTGHDAVDITQIMRCETRDAIREAITDYAKTFFKKEIVYENLKGPEFAKRYASPEAFLDIKWEKFNPEMRDLFQFYANTSVNYDFTIDTTENNVNGFDGTFLKAFTRSGTKVALTARSDLTRGAKDHYQTFESFDSLVRLMPVTQCAKVPATQNILFPAVGRKKLKDLFMRFIVLNQNANLGGEKTDWKTATMATTLTFSTKFTGNLNPSTSHDPVLGRIVPSSLSFTSNNSRIDAHTIIILIQLPVDRSNSPSFDGQGRLTLAGADRQIDGKSSLARERENNSQDAIKQLSDAVSRAAE